MNFCPKKQAQIKRKLLDAQKQQIRNLTLYNKSLDNKNQQHSKFLINHDLSQWSTQMKISQFGSLPYLDKKKNDKNNLTATTSMNLTNYLQKITSIKQRSKSSLANQINISFNPQTDEREMKKRKQKRSSILAAQLNSLKNQTVYINLYNLNKKTQQKTYLINGKPEKLVSPQKQVENNQSQRSSHLLRLLRQRQLLRKKRYSFDYQSGITAKSFRFP